jgi:hypothetical protein
MVEEWSPSVGAFKPYIIDDLRTHILGYFKNEDTGLCAAGVPKCVAILNEQRTTNTLLRTLPTLIIDVAK